MKYEYIKQEDTSKYKSVLNLNNKDDFEKLRDGTDMDYNNIDKDTKIVYINGMDNPYKDASASQNMIQKDFPNAKVGLINNETGKNTGVLDDIFEWVPNSLTKKDVLNAHKLQELSPDTIVVTHSAGNEDIYKANQVNKLVNAQTPYKLISVGSPKSKTDLENSASKVGAKVITQINHQNDHVTIPNWDANYDIDWKQKIPIYDDLKKNHNFKNYYKKVNVKEEISKAINDE
jgi:filamentous hemagglutinin